MGVPPAGVCATLQQDIFPKKPLWIYDGGTDKLTVFQLKTFLLMGQLFATLLQCH